MRRLAILLIACPVIACAFGPLVRNMMLEIASRRDDVGIEGFRVTFLTGTTPANIELGASYTGPGDPSLALYDSGDGVWHEYTSKTIPVVGDYVAFKGDWRDSLGRYAYMFSATFQSANYTCKFSGMLEATPDVVASVYRQTFRLSTALRTIEDNPLPILVGAPAEFMFRETFSDSRDIEGALPEGFMDTRGLTGPPAANMFSFACWNLNNVTGALPAGFMDTSGLEGAPAASMFQSACLGMSGVTSLPAGFMDTSGLFGVPAADMLRSACQGMSGVTSLPAGFMDTSGLEGAPAARMIQFACYNMSSVTNAYTFNLGAGIDFNSTNVVGPLTSAFRGMPQWGGQVMWGTNVLVEAIPAPDSRISTFLDSTNMPNYDIIDANWK